MIRNKAAEIPVEWMDEIPTRPSVFKARLVSIAVFMLAGLAAAAYLKLPAALDAFLSRNGAIAILFQKDHTTASLKLVFQLFGALSILCALAGAAGLVRNRITYQALRLPLLAVYLLVGFYAWITWQACASILTQAIDVDGAKQDSATRHLLWWSVSSPALAVAAYAAWCHVMLRSRSVYAAFTRLAGDPMGGDRVLEDLRTHGRDIRHRRSLYASVFTHLFILVFIPWVMSLGGCVEAYKVPKGSGNPVVAMVKMVKPKKKKKKQTLSLRPNSAILFEIPDLDDTQVDQKMQEETEQTYQASNARSGSAKAGKMGKGGGSEGGWPEGMEDYKLRFIRLDHGGGGWDDGMDQTNADINFLRAFAQSTGFKKIASKGESHSIALLKKYPKDGFPPFVFLTGNSDMGRVSAADMKILRDYCLNGGMLIADAGSARFHQSFTHFMRQVFPDKPMVDIADDEMIYQLPYGFPDGAPAFWHHGGRRALGIKHEGRWVCFYHPGDMNDAWKSQDYTDVTPEMRDAAMNLGINLVYYAFNQWNDAVAKAKK
jgi:hypothetical protein